MFDLHTRTVTPRHDTKEIALNAIMYLGLIKECVDTVAVDEWKIGPNGHRCYR